MIVLVLTIAPALALDFGEAVRAAVAQGAAARIVEAEADRAVAEARSEAAWTGNPELELERIPGETTVTIGVPVELAGQVFVRASAARSAVEGAALRAEAGRAAVGAAAGAGYLDAVRARERAELAGTAEALALRVRDAAERRVSAGELSVVDAALIQADAARALDLALTLRREADTTTRRLAVLVGADTATVGDWPRVPDPPTVEPDAVPAVLAAGLEARAALAGLTAERLARVPDLRVVGGWSFEGHPGPIVGAGIELPLFAPGARHVEQAGAEADLAAARADQESLEAGVALADARAELAVAERVAAAWAIPGLEGALEAATRRYEAGELALAAYVAERDLALSALGGAIDARWRVERARLALWELAGRLPVEEG